MAGFTVPTLRLTTSVDFDRQVNSCEPLWDAVAFLYSVIAARILAWQSVLANFVEPGFAREARSVALTNLRPNPAVCCLSCLRY